MGRKAEEQKIQDGRELISKEYSESRYERFQLSVFCFLEQPKNKIAIFYHIVNLIFIVASVVIAILSTVQYFENDETFNAFTLVFEMGLLGWFTVEYLFRTWSCSVLKRFKGWRGRLKFVRNFYMCVDAFIIISTSVTSLMQVDRSYFTILRATRFLQVFRILRVDRQKGDLGMMLRVVKIHHRYEIYDMKCMICMSKLFFHFLRRVERLSKVFPCPSVIISHYSLKICKIFAGRSVR